MTCQAMLEIAFLFWRLGIMGGVDLFQALGMLRGCA